MHVRNHRGNRIEAAALVLLITSNVRSRSKSMIRRNNLILSGQVESRAVLGKLRSVLF